MKLGEKMRIDICLTSDENYVEYMGALIVSVLKNSGNNDIFFHIIIDSISEENKSKLISLKKIKNCEIIFYHDIDLNRYERLFEKTADKIYWSPACYYRLEIPNLIKNADKILYLDCDIIVRKDISELFNIDISEVYLAAVTHPINTDIFKTRIGLTINDKYFCAGMLLINNKLFIKDKLKEICIEFLENSKTIYAQDQDALVIATKNKVKIIDEKYSYFAYRGYHAKAVDIEDINLIHYASAKKPWLEDIDGCYYVEEFWKYFFLTPWFQENPSKYIDIMISQKINLLRIELSNQKLNNLVYGRYSENWIKFFGIYNNKDYIFIYIFFIKFTIKINEKNINKIAWWIPVRKWRDSFRNKFLI